MMKRILKFVLILILVLGLAVIGVATYFISSIMNANKDVVFDKQKLITASTQIAMLDNQNNEFDKNSNVIRPVIEIDKLPKHVPDSFISIEDKRFYNHSGLDYKRIAKAFLNNLSNGQITEGASTISQQLIKNTHLSNERTYSRKVKEMFLTRKLEKEFSKKDILETYLNIIYFGEGAYGIESASQTFFGKPATELTISQSATLAGLIKSPAKYSPIYNAENAKSRRNLVLRQMLANGKITQSQHDIAISEPITVHEYENNQNTSYNLYAKAALKEASKILDLSEKDTASQGYKIYTYLNAEHQNTINNAVNNESNYHVNSYGNIADSLAIVVDNQTNGITAFAGKSKYDLTDFKRQPGSTLKPILSFAPALEKGLINPSTQILDEKVDYNGYSPNNVGGNFHGYVSVRESLSKSLNIPAIKMLDYVGIEEGKKLANRVGIEFDETDNGLSVALGGLKYGNDLKSLTNSFTAFANNGMYRDAKFIKKIEDKNGKVLYENPSFKSSVMSQETAYLMNNMLIDGVKNGTSARLKNLTYEVAGKTGTVAVPSTNQNSDAFSIAYTTNHTMGVWLGNYSNNPANVLESKNNGGTYATQIIKDSFNEIYQTDLPKPFNKPIGIVEVDIDIKALEEEHLVLLASNNCPDRYKFKEVFNAKFTPTEQSQIFDNLNVESFDVNYFNNIATISFDAKDYLMYEVIRIENNKETVLSVIENKKEKIVYESAGLKPNTKYGYKVKVFNNHSNSYNYTETVVILTNKSSEYEKLFESNLVKPKDQQLTNWFYSMM